ncbi:hypothetical protein B0H34DRAFT_724985 [Crassisporium funariophilum]|nr:hypothetical protein B0H34DRAFT_724985 [Crassisporium funariophilum]
MVDGRVVCGSGAASILVGPPVTTEGLEIVLLPGVGCSFRFDVPTVLAVTGNEMSVKVNMGLSDAVEVRGSAGWAIEVGGWIRGGGGIWVCVPR